MPTLIEAPTTIEAMVVPPAMRSTSKPGNATGNTSTRAGMIVALAPAPTKPTSSAPMAPTTMKVK